MPAPTTEAAPPRTELQELQLKAQEKTDEVGLRSKLIEIFFWSKIKKFFANLTFITFVKKFFSRSNQHAECWLFAKR